jgi:hypothetical protein
MPYVLKSFDLLFRFCWLMLAGQLMVTQYRLQFDVQRMAKLEVGAKQLPIDECFLGIALACKNRLRNIAKNRNMHFAFSWYPASSPRCSVTLTTCRFMECWRFSKESSYEIGVGIP